MRRITTPRLVLEPQTAAHAAEMFDVLHDPAIYDYENEPPASLAWLAERFAKLESRRSADGTEQWLNWVVRMRRSTLIGFVQATLRADRRAAIAYVLGSAHWGRGLAHEAVAAMIAHLAAAYDIALFTATVKRENRRSLRLLERLSFVPAGPELAAGHELEHDETLLWRAAAPADRPMPDAPTLSAGMALLQHGPVRMPTEGAAMNPVPITTGVTIRPYAERDFTDLVARWHETNRASYPYVALQRQHTLADAQAFFRSGVLARCRVVVAEVEAGLAGVLALEAPWIRQLAVFAGHRRSGIGTALLDAARAISPAELRLHTFRQNAPARAFYTRHGFVPVALGVSPAPELAPDVEFRWRADGLTPAPAAPKRNCTCPLCGGPNDCAPARTGSFDTPCWCTSVTIDPGALARIPDAARNEACLCRRCATGRGGDA